MLWLPLLAQLRALRAQGNRGNPFVNGAMRVAQRGTIGALATTPAISAIDAWWANQNGAADGFIHQQADTSNPGFNFRLRAGRNPGSAVLGIISVATVAESLDCTRYAGKVCNLNFWGIKGANYSAAASALQVQLLYGTGTDQTGAQLLTGAWTGVGAAISQNVTLAGSSWTRYSIPVLIPAGKTQLGLIFSFTPTGIAGADDSFYLSGVQLNEGAAAAPFDTTFYCDDFARCLRRLPVFDAAMSTGDRWNGPALSTTAAVFWIPFPVVARIPPTGMVVPDITKWSVFCGRNSTIGAGVSSFFNGNGRYTGGIQVAFTAGSPTVVAGDLATLLANATSAKMIFTGAEL